MQSKIWHKKSNVKQGNTLYCLDKYLCRGGCETVGTLKRSVYITTCRAWRSRNSRAVKQSMWSWLLCIYSSGKTTGFTTTISLVVKPGIIKFWLKKLNLTLNGKMMPDINKGILSNLFCTSDLYLIILAWTGNKLPCAHACGGRTYAQTNGHIRKSTQQPDAGYDNTRRPKLALSNKTHEGMQFHTSNSLLDVPNQLPRE